MFSMSSIFLTRDTMTYKQDEYYYYNADDDDDDDDGESQIWRRMKTATLHPDNQNVRPDPFHILAARTILSIL